MLRPIALLSPAFRCPIWPFGHHRPTKKGSELSCPVLMSKGAFAIKSSNALLDNPFLIGTKAHHVARGAEGALLFRLPPLSPRQLPANDNGRWTASLNDNSRLQCSPGNRHFSFWGLSISSDAGSDRLFLQSRWPGCSTLPDMGWTRSPP